MSAISAIQEIGEDTFLHAVILGLAAFGVLGKFLYSLPSLTVNDGFMNVPKDRPILLWIVYPRLVTEGLGVCLEVDDVTTILLLSEHLGYGSLTPLVRIGLCFLTASAHAFTLPICHRH